jgi:hypothetical protein
MSLRGFHGMGICLGVSKCSFDHIHSGASKLQVEIIVGAKAQQDRNALRQLPLIRIRHEDIYNSVPTESLAFYTNRWEWRSKSENAMIRVYFLDGKAVYKLYSNYATTPPIVEEEDLRHRE